MPLSLSTRDRYGVRLMVALALNYGNGITLLREVSRREGISEKYLGQIVLPLKSAGLITSQRGSHGGYALGRPPEKVTVKDIVEAMEGSITSVLCADEPEGDGSRSTARATTRVWKRLCEDVEESLSSFTLAFLAREAKELSSPNPSFEI
jgi:Rrf2 family protein